MIERLEVPCPTCGESGFTLGKIWNQGEWVNTHVVCPACHGEKVVPESDAAYIERMKRVIDELAASKQENGNLFDRLRMMAQEVTGRDCDIERLTKELACANDAGRSLVDNLLPAIEYLQAHGQEHGIEWGGSITEWIGNNLPQLIRELERERREKAEANGCTHCRRRNTSECPRWMGKKGAGDASDK